MARLRFQIAPDIEFKLELEVQGISPDSRDYDVQQHKAEVYQEFEATNEGRVAKMQAVMKVFYDDTPETDLIDLLADARHLCDARGLDFHRLDRTAHHHYTVENVRARTEER